MNNAHRPRIGWRLRRAAADERGVTLLLTLGVMVFTLLTLAALLTYTANSTIVVRTDKTEKQAYYAAQAGLQVFEFRLQSDPNYWASCENLTTPVAVPGSGSTPTEWYEIKPIPATGQTSCDPNNIITTMIEPGTSKAISGTYRYEFIGCTTSTCSSTGSRRAVVVSFKRSSFLNFVYFTEYETIDPTADPSEPTATSGSGSCYQNQSQRPSTCALIQFQSGDTVSGPLHSNDQVVACGSPTFGRTSQSDTFEDQGTPDCPGGSSNPIYNGTKNFSASTLSMPPSNSSLAQIAAQGAITGTYSGPTDITLLTGGKMTVTNGGTTTTVSYPTNKVVYVSSGSGNCSDGYTPFGSVYDDPNDVGKAWYDAADNGCPDVYVSGTYDTSLTIASAGDIVINGNITTNTSGSALLGLIAQNFVRIFRPVQGRYADMNPSAGHYTPYGYTRCSSPNSDGAGAMSNPTIDAAILALTGSFIVDNYDCGNNEVDLNVTGAIAQVFRGPVGTSGGTGYDKNYVYDDRLAAEEPPNYLNPVQAGWNPYRSTLCFVQTPTTNVSCPVAP